jgi:RNA 2',3'-cyclic 3'-phosphodiesterase
MRSRTQAARWIPPQNLHVTMMFLGNVADDAIEPIATALASAASSAQAGSTRLEGVGAFPNPKRPRVLWVGLNDPSEVLARLAASVGDALEPLGFVREQRRFRPHVTIARIPRPTPMDLDGIAVEPLEVPVREVVLMRSHLGKGSARYEALMRWPLA